MKSAYEKFRRDDPITDQEIRDLLKAIKAAEPYLEASPIFDLMRVQAVHDRYALEGYQQARKEVRSGGAGSQTTQVRRGVKEEDRKEHA